MYGFLMYSANYMLPSYPQQKSYLVPSILGVLCGHESSLQQNKKESVMSNGHTAIQNYQLYSSTHFKTTFE